MDLIIHNNTAQWGNLNFRCSIGSAGLTNSKIEGDKKTPIGRYIFQQIFYRPDRLSPPKTILPISEITPSCGWCDDPSSTDYNKYIKKPFSYSHEDLWIDQHLYDLIIAIGHNDNPPIPGKGSAIFIHIASDNYGPTDGCVGLAKEDLITVVSEADSTSHIAIIL